MGYIRGQSGSRKIRGYRDGEDIFVSAAARDHQLSPTTTVDSAVKDAMVAQTTFGAIDHEFDLVPNVPLDQPQNFSIRNLTPSIVQMNGLSAARLADGLAQVIFFCAKGRKVLNQQVSRTPSSSTVPVWTGWIAGSLANHASDQIDGLIAGKSASAATFNLWSTRNDATASYVWNSGIWAAGIDLTCISPWNDWQGGSNWKGGTLISPRHLLCANHIALTNRQTIRFVTAANITVTRTIASGIQVDPSHDIYLCKLDSDVPAGIGFAHVLPSNWRSYLPTMDSAATTLITPPPRIPALWTNQFKTLKVSDWTGVNSSPNLQASYAAPIDAQRLSFYSPVVVGDSGSPAFALVNGHPLLLSSWWSPVSGDMVSDFIAEIDATMTALGGGYQLTIESLSGFPTF